jgi:hypothetical protein
MATTLSLNSSNSIMVTTYWDGDRGRCYTFHIKSGNSKFVMDGTESELIEALMNYFEIEVEGAGTMPDPDNRWPQPKPADLQVELLKITDERRAFSNCELVGSALMNFDNGRHVMFDGVTGILRKSGSDWIVEFHGGGSTFVDTNDAITLLPDQENPGR